ncbi:MAG: S-layer homology domain-containing protein, partial [Oscillibacter sp.]
MKSRKLISLVLSLAMVLSLVTVPAFAADAGATTPISAAKSFPDTVDHWAEKAIGRWAGYGVVKGDEAGKFNPDADLTRASLATILADFLKLSTKAKNEYSDVPADAWYADAVLKCTAAGILKGSEGLAKPGDNVSRQEAMVMIGRALGIAPAAKADLTGFTDGATVADWAAGYVTALTQSKIVAGVGENQVAPLVNINRASILSILDKA